MANECFRTPLPHPSPAEPPPPKKSPQKCHCCCSTSKKPVRPHVGPARDAHGSTTPRLNPSARLYGCQLNTHKYYIHAEGMQNWNIQVITYLAGSVPRSGANEEQVSGCCFNQVESRPHTDLQLVERPVVHMGFIMGLGENQSRTIVFPLL